MPLTKQSAQHKDQDAGYTKMQHRHFATIAKIIKAHPYGDMREMMAHHFADELVKTNPQFDRERFLAACER